MNTKLIRWASVLKTTLKIIPMLMAFFCVLSTILSFFSINVIWINYIAGISLLPILFLYIASYAFQFCEYHRMFLHYIVIDNIICWIDTYIGIPLPTTLFLGLLLIIAGVFLFLILKMKFFNKKLRIKRLSI